MKRQMRSRFWGEVFDVVGGCFSIERRRLASAIGRPSHNRVARFLMVI
jgi:hypothetical protein